MSESLNWIPAEMQAFADSELLRDRREVRPLGGGRCLVDGHEVWNFASNDYLGLSDDPQVIAAAIDATRIYGVGAKASALVSGRTECHASLERVLAEFEGTEAAVLFPTGMAANTGTVAALAGPDDIIFSDRLNHAGLIDGSRASGARIQIYQHDDLDSLNQLMSTSSARRKFIVTDSIFGMDGDLAPLKELCDLGDRYGADLVIDEAHGTGVFGENGRGVAELLGVDERVAVRIGTLSKAIGGLGGFVTGSQALIDFLWNKARTQIFSTAMPPACCAAAAAAIHIIRTEPTRRTQLHTLSKSFRGYLEQSGVQPCPGSVGPIVPIVLHEPQAAMKVTRQLFEEGFLVAGIRPPSVPQGTSRLRISLQANLPDDAAKRLAHCIADAVHDLKRS